jgi:glutamate carboxypeptidase
VSEVRDIAATARALHARLVSRREQMLADMAELVAIDSPSDDVAALGRAADWLEEWLAPVGRVRSLPAPDGRRHLLLETAEADERGALILCHYDTVWPVGTADAWRFETAGELASGPGLLDMKASIVCARHALLGLQELGVPLRARLLVSADEEIGNPSSRELIHELAAPCAAALVLEPPLDDGRLKTARKGHGHATIEVTGRAAHAGVAPEQGINAIEQMAGIVQQVRAVAASIPGSSATVGRIEGGGALNVVPEQATIGIDLRAWSADDMAALVARVQALRPQHPDAAVAIAARVDRPPLERRPSTVALLERCALAARAVGLEVRDGGTGGCSEGNLAQAAGAPVLDGLGVRGSGPHTREERIALAHVLPQAAVVGALAADVGRIGND